MTGTSQRRAIVYCEGAFNTPNGKTAHGLVRFTRRYELCAVIDSRYSGQDAGEALDGRPAGIPLCGSLEEAIDLAAKSGESAEVFVVGLAPDGGRLNPEARTCVADALRRGLDVHCGLHDFLSEDPELSALADTSGASIVDVRKPQPRGQLHFFSGKIEEVTSPRIAVLGTDSAVGKRTTAWKLVEGLEGAGRRAELVGTGQTAWMQGARFSIPMDSLINDFVSGEIEHAVWSAWKETSPDVIVIEGQGSLMNPAYPGGFEILAAGRPSAVVVQHAPARKDYDGFPGYPIHPLPRQIEAIEMLSGRPVIAVTLNHEGVPHGEIPALCKAVSATVGLPVFDVLLEGGDALAAVVLQALDRTPGRGAPARQ